MQKFTKWKMWLHQRNCWFNHNEHETNDKEMEENTENKEVIQKIFQMMENRTIIIIKLKEMNNLQ